MLVTDYLSRASLIGFFAYRKIKIAPALFNFSGNRNQQIPKWISVFARNLLGICVAGQRKDLEMERATESRL
jgi:hypothetical protein